MSISTRRVRLPQVGLDTDDERRATVKYLMLVCWNAENMDAQTEPDPADTPRGPCPLALEVNGC